MVIWDHELLEEADNKITPSILYSGSPGLQYSAAALPAKFKQAVTNRYAYIVNETKSQAPNTAVGLFEPSGPFRSFGKIISINYSNPTVNMGYWNSTASNADDAASPTNLQRNFPAALNGTSMANLVDFITPTSDLQQGTYIKDGNPVTFYDFDNTVTHAGANARHWLAFTLGDQEVSSKLTSKPRYPFYWLFSENPYHQAPKSIAEGTAIFPWFTNIAGMVHWDDFAGAVLSTRTYDCYVHFTHGLYRLFNSHKDMLEGSPTYLQENTDFRVINVTNPNTNNNIDNSSSLLNQWISSVSPSGKAEAWYLKEQKLPFVRAIVKDCEILVAATFPYANANTTAKVVVRYAPKNWQDTITLNGDEIYLGRATMKRPIRLQTDGTFNISSTFNTTLCAGRGYCLTVSTADNNYPYEYGGTMTSNTTVFFTTYNTAKDKICFGRNQTGQYNLQIYAPSACGYNSRTIYVTVVNCYSGYRVAPNPAQDVVSVTFDSADGKQALPASIELLGEKSTKALRSIDVGSAFDKKQLTGNKIELDVKDLPRGTYYLHLKYPQTSGEVKTDQVRILLNN